MARPKINLTNSTAELLMVKNVKFEQFWHIPIVFIKPLIKLIIIISFYMDWLFIPNIYSCNYLGEFSLHCGTCTLA